MEYKIVIQAAFKPLSLEPPSDDMMMESPIIETLNFPTGLQYWILKHKDEFEEEHPGVYPNVLVLQDDVFVPYQFPKHIRDMNQEDRPEWFNKQFRELYEKLNKWQGQMLFQWHGLKVYNRGHVIGNRDLPMIFLEVK